MAPETLSGNRVRKVYLHERQAHPDQPVPQCHARVGQPSGVDQEAVDPLAGLL